MLIGPTLTLAELEEKMGERLYAINMEIPKLTKKLKELDETFRVIPRVVVEDRNGKSEEVVNPEFLKIPDQIKAIQAEISQLEQQKDLIQDRLAELEDIEERSLGRGNIDKQKHKITLTLNDCLKLGIE